MATITFTTRCTNETVSLPSEEAIERLFADADEWFAFQHRAPETEIEVNGVPMAISIKEEGGIAIRPGEWADGMYEDWEKTDRTALLSDINRMACRPMGTIGAPTIGEVREYGDCLWNDED